MATYEKDFLLRLYGGMVRVRRFEEKAADAGIKTPAIIVVGETAALAAALSVFAGRFALTAYILISHYARESGLGKILYTSRPYAGTLIGLIISLLLSFFFFGNCLFILPTLIFIVLWNEICIWQIRGATGDTIGACEQLTEVLVCFQLFILA